MSSIDSRIVEMRFDNEAFQKRVAETNSALSDLKKGLNFSNTAQSLNGLKLDNLNSGIGGLGGALQSIASKFNGFGVVGATVISKLTSSFMDLGFSTYKNLTEPLVEGGKRRAENIAQAKFQLEGLKVSWESIEPAINHAVKGTAYGLDEAAKAASSLVASKVSLDKMPTSLRAISGVAAMTNSSYTDMAGIFTTVAGNGRLMSSELNRISSRGLNAAAAIGEYLGVTEAEVREMTTKGKISFDIFAAAMDNAFGEQATKANQLYSGALANVRAALARIGAVVAQGQFEKMRRIFEQLAPVIDKVKVALDPLLDWIRRMNMAIGKYVANFLQGLDFSYLNEFFAHIAKGMTNIHIAVYSLIKPMVDAWNAIFPPDLKKRAKVFTGIGKSFEDFTAKLIIGEETGKKIQKVFEVLFSVFKTLGEIIGNVFTIVKPAFKFLIEALGWLADVAKIVWEAIGELTNRFINFVRTSKPIQDTIKKLADIFKKLKDALGKTFLNIMERLGDAFDAMGQVDTLPEKIRAFMDAFAGMGGELKVDFSFLIPKINIDWGAIWARMKEDGLKIWKFLEPVFTVLRDLIVESLGGIKDAVSNLNLKDLSTLADIVSKLGVAFAGFKALRSAEGLMDTAAGAIGSLSSAIKSFNQESKADQFIKVAFGIALLAGALYLIGQIEPKRLWDSVGALGALAGGMIVLTGVLTGVSKVITPGMLEILEGLASSMMKIAIAVGILAGAVWVLSSVDPAKMWNAVGGLAVVMLSLVAAMAGIGKLASGGGLIKASFAIMSVATAVMMMSFAIKMFAGIPWSTIEDGLMKMVSVMGPLVLSLVAIGYVSKNMAGVGAAIIGMAGAILILAYAIKVFAGMDANDLNTGMTAVMTLMLTMSAAILIMSKAASKAPIAAVGMVAFAAAIVILAFAVKMLSELDPSAMAASVLSIIALMGAMVLVSQQIQKAAAGAALMIGIALAVLAVAGAFSLMANIPTGQLVTVAVVLAAIIVVLGLFVAVAHKFVVGGAIVIGILLALSLVMFTVSVAIDAFANLIATAANAFATLGPSLSGLAEGLSDLDSVAKKMDWETIGKIAVLSGIAVIVGPAAIIIGAAASLLGRGLKDMGAGLKSISKYGDDAAGPLKRLIGTLMDFSDGLGDAMVKMAEGSMNAATMAQLGDGLKKLGDGTKAISEGMKVLKDVKLDGFDVLPKIAEAMTAFTDTDIAGAIGADVLIKAMKGLGTGLTELKVGMDALAGLNVDTLNVLPKIAEQMKPFSTGDVLNASSVAIVVGSMDSLGQGLVSLKQGLDAFGEFNESSLQVLRALPGALKGFISLDGQGTGSVFDGIRNALQGWSLNAVSEGLVALGKGLIEFTDGLMHFNAQENIGTAIENMKTLGTSFDWVDDINDGNVGKISTMVDALEGITNSYKYMSQILSNDNMSGNLTHLKQAISTMADESMLAGVDGLKTAQIDINRYLTDLDTSIANAIESLNGKAGEFESAASVLGLAIQTGLDLADIRVDVAADNILSKLGTSMSTKATAWMGNATSGIVGAITTGINSSSGTLTTAGGNISNNIKNGIDSQRSAINTAGRNTVDSYVSGIASSTSGLRAAGATAVTFFVLGTVMEAGRARSAGYSIGDALAAGMINGMNARQNDVRSAAASLASAAEAAAKAAADVRSPSRKFHAIGEFMGIGEANGLTSTTGLVRSAAAKLTSAAITAATYTAGIIESIFDDDMVMEPVIRPVLDLTNVRNGSSTIDSLFSTMPFDLSGSIELARLLAESRAQSEQPPADDRPVEFKYEQNIYSPEPLDELTVYKNTSSLLGRAKKELEEKGP